MKKILKKIVRFCKNLVFLLFTFTFLVTPGLQIMLSEWLGSWIFWFAICSVGIYLTYRIIRFMRIVHVRGRKETFKKHLKDRNTPWMQAAFCLTYLIPYIIIMWLITIPIFKHTVISSFHHDTSVTRVFTVEDVYKPIRSASRLITTVEQEFDAKNYNSWKRKKLITCCILHDSVKMGERFIFRYLPDALFNGSLILSIQEIPREEETVIVQTKLENLPGREEVASLEESLGQVLRESGNGRIERSIQQIFNDKDIHSWENERTLLVDNQKRSNLFITGKSANAIFDAILPVLFQYPFLRESKVELRYLDRSRDLSDSDAIKVDEMLLEGFTKGSYKNMYDFHETAVE